MTKLQKSVIAATLTVAIGAAIYEVHQNSQLRKQAQTHQQRQASLTGQIEQLQRERDDASNRLGVLVDENANLKNDSAELLKLREELSRLKAADFEPAETESNATQLAAKSWVDRVTQLKQRLEKTPEAKIPELQFVTEQDWLHAARGELKTEADYRRALSAIRAAGEGKTASMLGKAVKGYMQGNNGQFPSDLGQLQPYFDSPVDDAVLQRWEIVPASAVKGFKLGGENVVITQKAPVDDVFDMLFVVGSQGSGSTGFLYGEIGETMKPVRDAFKAAHGGQSPNDTSQLEPYVTTPEQRAAFDKLMLSESYSK